MWKHSTVKRGNYLIMVKKFIEGYLAYNPANGRYGLLISDLWQNKGFHCGEEMYILTDGRWKKTAIEMKPDGTWYLVGYSGKMDFLKIKVKI